MTPAVFRIGALLVVWLMSVPAASAQTRESHWGVSASLVPRWQFPQALANIWNMDTDMRGSEMRVGIVRGSDLGGDVGLSFVKKFVSDGSTVFLRQSACVEVGAGQSECARGAYHVTRDAGMTGVEAHIFMPFATIRERVQIGVTFAGGVARIDGTSDRFIEHLVVNGGNVTVVTDTAGSGPFQQSLQDLPQDWDVVPIGRVELSVGYLARPGLKLRATGGVNFPGFHRIGLHVQYLFGARR
jgi:hypothetical protein